MQSATSPICLLFAIMLSSFLLPTVVATASTSIDYNFVMRFLHPDHGQPNLPNCVVHSRRLNRRIQAVFARNHHLSRRRELSAYDNINCSSFCQNIPAGYCYFVSGGICSNRRRNLRSTTTTAPPASNMLSHRALTSATTGAQGCALRSARIEYEIFRYGNTVSADDPCKSIFYDQWDIDCFYVDGTAPPTV